MPQALLSGLEYPYFKTWIHVWSRCFTLISASQLFSGRGGKAFPPICNLNTGTLVLDLGEQRRWMDGWMDRCKDNGLMMGGSYLFQSLVVPRIYF